MKDDTTFTSIGGSWYCRIPPSFVKHLGLDEEKGSVGGSIQDEENKKKQHYCSIWKNEDSR